MTAYLYVGLSIALVITIVVSTVLSGYATSQLDKKSYLEAHKYGVGATAASVASLVISVIALIVYFTSVRTMFKV